MMTAAAGSRAKTAAPRSNVDVVIDRLHPSILASLFGPSYPHDHNAIRRRASLVADANESLRLLKARRANLGPRDSGRVRAALVIEYLGRNAPSNDGRSSDPSNATYRRVSMPANMLAGAAGLSTSARDRRAMEVMQTVISSQLDGSSVGDRLRKQQRGCRNDRDDMTGRKRDAPTSAVTTTTATSRTGPISTLRPTDLIRDLCIRLGPMIPDAEFVVSCALGTFRCLSSGTLVAEGNDDDNDRGDGTSKKVRRFSAYELFTDMERHQIYYEVACFFLAVKWSEGGNSHYLINGQNRNRTAVVGNSKAARKDDEWAGDGADGRTEAGGGGGEEEDDIDDERHLAETDVISEANLLEGTFKEVLACVREMTSGMSIATIVAGDGFGSNSNGGSSTLFEVVGGNNDRSTGMDPPDSAFEQWKRRVLLEAKTTAAIKLTGRRDNGKYWLMHAADEVLYRAGLMHLINKQE